MSDPHSPTGTTTTRAETDTVVVCANEQDEVSLDPGRYAALAASVLTAERYRGELTLTFVGRDEMASLYAEHMHGNGEATDVLSFPLDAAEAAGDADGADRAFAVDPDGQGAVLLGDVVVCPAVAADQAPTHAGTLDDELALLVVHGVLHVLGWDHATTDETLAMRLRERELLTVHFWNGPPPPGFRRDLADGRASGDADGELDGDRQHADRGATGGTGGEMQGGSSA